MRTGRAETARRSTRLGVAVLALLAVGVAGCDDQVKWVPWFSTMTEQPAIQTYEEQPRPPVEGTVPVGAERSYTLEEADALLENPLEGTDEQIGRGAVTYREFCLPCHGRAGEGDGPVVNVSGNHPLRLPPIPTLDLTSGSSLELSDGYIWGMIENGRLPLMPSYERIDHEKRWELILYIRQLQQEAREGSAPEGGSAGSGGGEASAGSPGRATGAGTGGRP